MNWSAKKLNVLVKSLLLFWRIPSIYLSLKSFFCNWNIYLILFTKSFGFEFGLIIILIFFSFCWQIIFLTSNLKIIEVSSYKSYILLISNSITFDSFVFNFGKRNFSKHKLFLDFSHVK